MIPAGAMPDSSTCAISKTSVDTPPVKAANVIGAYELSCADSDGNTVTAITSPATVTMKVPKSGLFSSFKYFAYTQNDSGWDNQKANYSVKNHTIVFKMNSPNTLVSAKTSPASLLLDLISLTLGLAVLDGFGVLIMRVRRNLLS